ncbi:hypothetical protein [Cupriavidus gilardii]|uniref:hypothetical protein n=1 Tax=Cupriavidus gilardii TaxID=82541 RepID=UPI0021B4A25C|nr:hypothetical protein [Cupriavidus gilardii]UXC37340.1 hypothetical protein N4G38_07855 [Cupriavidus gilardii]
MLDSIESPTRAQLEWLEQLRGPTMDFDPDRLTMDEFRAQCAMVTDAAKHRLPSTEYAAVLARYAHGEEKLAGCKRLALYARRSCGLTALSLLLDLTARHYLPKQQRQDLTFRALADKHGGSAATLFRAAKWMDTHYRALENLALERLEPSFTAHGLIANRTAAESAQSVAV